MLYMLTVINMPSFIVLIILFFLLLRKYQLINRVYFSAVYSVLCLFLHHEIYMQTVLQRLVPFFIVLIIILFRCLKKHQLTINRLYFSIAYSSIVALLLFLDAVFSALHNTFPYIFLAGGDGITIVGLLDAIFIGMFRGLESVLGTLWSMIIILAVHIVLLLSLRMDIVMKSVVKKA